MSEWQSRPYETPVWRAIRAAKERASYAPNAGSWEADFIAALGDLGWKIVQIEQENNAI